MNGGSRLVESSSQNLIAGQYSVVAYDNNLCSSSPVVQTISQFEGFYLHLFNKITVF